MGSNSQFFFMTPPGGPVQSPQLQASSVEHAYWGPRCLSQEEIETAVHMFNWASRMAEREGSMKLLDAELKDFNKVLNDHVFTQMRRKYDRLYRPHYTAAMRRATARRRMQRARKNQ